jgi:hypothetical protein
MSHSSQSFGATATIKSADEHAIVDGSCAGFFFSADISEISPKTGFIGDHRYSLIPNEIFRYS